MIVRVRHAAGTWRVTIESGKSKVGDVMREIESSHNVAMSEQRLTLDPSESSEGLNTESVLEEIGVSHGTMMYLHTSAQLTTSTTVRRTIRSDGNIVAQEYDSYTQSKGFRPGMAALGDMKKAWTLTDFLIMDDQFNFKIKRQEDAECKGVSLDTSSCVSFQSYMQELGWRRRRAGLLYGTFDEEQKVTVESIYELEDEDGEDPFLETVEEVAKSLGLRRVGWIFAHSPREEGFVFSGAEIIKTAEYQLEAADGVEKTPFVTVKVTVDQNGQSNFEAYQVSLQCMAMVAEGALGVNEDDLAACDVHPTFTAVVEGKAADHVNTNFFLCNVPVSQHQSLKFTAGARFPKMNRPIHITPDDLKPSLLLESSNKNQSGLVTQGLADFGLVLYLASLPNIFDPNTFLRALIDAINESVPDIDDGYRLILFSYAGLDAF